MDALKAGRGDSMEKTDWIRGEHSPLWVFSQLTASLKSESMESLVYSPGNVADLHIDQCRKDSL